MSNELETLLDIYKVIFSTLDTNKILYLMVKKISEMMRVARCSIILINKDHRTGHIVATYEDPELNTMLIDLNKYPEILKSVEADKFVFIKDVNIDPIMRDVKDSFASLGIKSILVIPIHYSEGAIGTMYLRTSRKERTFSQADIKTCQLLSNMVSVALNNAHLFSIIQEEKALLETMAVTDDMTRLYNHRYFVRRLKEELKRAGRYKYFLSCIMLDIDNFKGINDTYGHQSGDSVLQDVGKIIKGIVRETDVVARYGGEEFSVILPHADCDSASRLANRIRDAIKNHRFDALGDGMQITASIGVSTYPHPGIKDIDDLIRKADDGLYQAKRRGKDMVVSV